MLDFQMLGVFFAVDEEAPSDARLVSMVYSRRRHLAIYAFVDVGGVVVVEMEIPFLATRKRFVAHETNVGVLGMVSSGG